MNNKILMTVLLPQLSRSFEAWVPTSLKFKVLNSLLGQVATTVTNGEFVTTEALLLCEASTGRPFALEKTPAKLGRGNGACVMLL